MPNKYQLFGEVQEMPGEMMPVLGKHEGLKNVPKEVPFAILNEQFAMNEHGQTLRRLKERGGLSIGEIRWNVGRSTFHNYRSAHQEDVDDVNRIVSEHLASRKSYPCSPELLKSLVPGVDYLPGVHFEIEYQYKSDNYGWVRTYPEVHDAKFIIADKLRIIAVPLPVPASEDELWGELYNDLDRILDSETAGHLFLPNEENIKPHIIMNLKSKYSISKKQ